MVLFSSASLLMSTFTTKALSPSTSVKASLKVTVTSAAAAASPSFVSPCHTLTLEMLASVPFRLSVKALMLTGLRLPSVFTFTLSSSWSAAPMDASAVVACVASMAVTVMSFDSYSETVAFQPSLVL